MRRGGLPRPRRAPRFAHGAALRRMPAAGRLPPGLVRHAGAGPHRGRRRTAQHKSVTGLPGEARHRSERRDGAARQARARLRRHRPAGKVLLHLARARRGSGPGPSVCGPPSLHAERRAYLDRRGKRQQSGAGHYRKGSDPLRPRSRVNSARREDARASGQARVREEIGGETDARRLRAAPTTALRCRRASRAPSAPRRRWPRLHPALFRLL